MEEAHERAGVRRDDAERERLGLLQASLDPLTLRRLECLPVGEGWRCLDVGAGSGSIARWLAAKVGPRGRVVATDIDTRFLVEHALPNLEVRRHNILEDDLEPAQYDLVHCRAVLMHLSDPVRALERMAAAVRPGGWLFIEEVDCGSFQPVDPEHPSAERFSRTYRVLFESVRAARVMDPYFGRRLRGLIEQLGLVEIQNEGATSIIRGGEPEARFQQMTMELGRGYLVAAGLLSDDDFEALNRAYADPSFAFVGGTLFAAWGRRAGG
jgi:SAM-dependent methyltransferase